MNFITFQSVFVSIEERLHTGTVSLNCSKKAVDAEEPEHLFMTVAFVI